MGRDSIDLGSLADVVAGPLGGRIVGDPSVVVSGMTHDSRLVSPGVLFACVRGHDHDGHAYAAPAVAAGAACLLVDHELQLAVPQLIVADTRQAMGPVAAAVYGRPSDALTMVGVTGTNGKTTTTHLLAAILRAAGQQTGMIGTLSGPHTTPEAPELQERLARFRDDGDVAVVMEVSSHALSLHRVDGTRFAVAVFTNLGTDHLDLHGSVEQYFRAKARLFAPDLAGRGVTNVDDPHGRLLFDAAPIEMVPYSIGDVTDLVVTADRHTFTWLGRHIEVGLGGRFNVMNSLAAATTAATLGIELDAIAEGLAGVHAVPGRFERVDVDREGAPTVIVDYAHTPDSLAEILGAAREVTDGSVLVVFGCGGDRDAGKRPQMGAVAAQMADRVIVTSDNPRSERPGAIIDAVVAGIAASDRSKVDVEEDRAAAIERALQLASPRDVVVVAGKGHETTQTIGAKVVPFDDRAVVRRLLEQRT